MRWPEMYTLFKMRTHKWDILGQEYSLKFESERSSRASYLFIGSFSDLDAMFAWLKICWHQNCQSFNSIHTFWWRYYPSCNCPVGCCFRCVIRDIYQNQSCEEETEEKEEEGWWQRRHALAIPLMNDSQLVCEVLYSTQRQTRVMTRGAYNGCNLRGMETCGKKKR